MLHSYPGEGGRGEEVKRQTRKQEKTRRCNSSFFFLMMEPGNKVKKSRGDPSSCLLFFPSLPSYFLPKQRWAKRSIFFSCIISFSCVQSFQFGLLPRVRRRILLYNKDIHWNQGEGSQAERFGQVFLFSSTLIQNTQSEIDCSFEKLLWRRASTSVVYGPSFFFFLRLEYWTWISFLVLLAFHSLFP